MPQIYPKITRAKLKSAARTTSEGRGRAPLPGVKTDAKHANATDKCGYQANRELAKLIQKAMRTVKKTRQGRAAFRARLAALSEQEASTLEQQGRAFVRVRMRVQRIISQ